MRANLFVNQTIIGDEYKRTVRYNVFPRINGYPESVIFQQDVAAQLNTFQLPKYLDLKLPNGWMAMHGRIP